MRRGRIVLRLPPALARHATLTVDGAWCPGGEVVVESGWRTVAVAVDVALPAVRASGGVEVRVFVPPDGTVEVGWLAGDALTTRAPAGDA